MYKKELLQSFGDLVHRPLLVDLTVEEGTRLKVIYGSADGFHAVDLDSASVYDIYIPKHVSIVTLLLLGCSEFLLTLLSVSHLMMSWLVITVLNKTKINITVNK